MYIVIPTSLNYWSKNNYSKNTFSLSDINNWISCKSIMKDGIIKVVDA